MNKILSFIIYNDKLLLLKGSSDDPQFHKSFWYVVTGGMEDIDNDFLDTVKREVLEETGLEVKKVIDLDWVFEYESLGKHCVERAYLSYVDSDDVILNEENIDFCWCYLDEFVEKIDWFGNKKELREKLFSYF